MDSPFTDYLFGDLMYSGQNSADAAGRCFVRNRAVSDGEMRLFEEAAAIDLEWDVFHPGGLATVIWGFDERFQDMPDLLPHLAHRQAKRPRVLGAKNRDIGVVIERAELRTPPKQLREPIGEEKTRHHSQSRRPVPRRTEGRIRPIVGAHQIAHLAAAGEQEIEAPRFRFIPVYASGWIHTERFIKRRVGRGGFHSAVVTPRFHRKL